MTVAEATKTLFDPRVTTVLDAADKKVIDAYNAKLGACLADKGDLALCKDIKLDMPSVSDMGAEPASAKHELYTGQLPAPRVVNAAPPDVKGPAR